MPCWRVSDQETGLACRDESVGFFFSICIMLYFNVLTTVLRKNQNTDISYLYAIYFSLTPLHIICFYNNIHHMDITLTQ